MLRALFPLVALGALTMAADADDPPKKDSKWTETVKVTGKHNPADPPPELLAEIEGWRREAAALAAKLVTAPAGQAAGSPPA